jgi:hypothetical protein
MDTVARNYRKFRGYRHPKDRLPSQTNSLSGTLMLDTLFAAMICLSLVSTTITSASAYAGEPIKLGLNVFG